MTIKCWNDTMNPKTNEWTMWFAAVRRAAETMAGRMTSSVGRHLRFVPAEPLMMTSPSHGRRIVMRAAENKKKKLFNFFSFRQRRLHFWLLWLLALRKEKLVTIFGHNGPSDCVGLVHSSASHSFAVRGTDASWVHTLLCSSSCHGCWRVKSLGAVVTSFLFV